MGLKMCPWCQNAPKLLWFGSLVKIACTNRECPVEPALKRFMLESKAKDQWNRNYKISKPVAFKKDKDWRKHLPKLKNKFEEYKKSIQG